MKTLLKFTLVMFLVLSSCTEASAFDVLSINNTTSFATIMGQVDKYLTRIGSGSPIGTVGSPIVGVTYWDSVGKVFYVCTVTDGTDSPGATTWVLESNTGGAGVKVNQANTYTTGSQDFNAATELELPLSSDPSSDAGAIWVNGSSLKVWDNAGSPVKHSVALTDQVSGDGTMTTGGVLTVTKTGGTVFAPSATSDTTNAANITSGVLFAARLPNPAASTLGGIESYTAVANQWINAISTSGVPGSTQPAFTDISGTATVAQGGTGAGSLSGHGAVVMNSGGTAQTTVAPSTAGNQFTSNGTDFISQGNFKSTDQTITAAGALILPHSLGYTPQRVWMALVNVTGEANYTTGQVVFMEAVPQGANNGYSAIVDGTNLTIRYGSGASTFTVPDATTGAATAITNANWNARFFAR